MTDTDNGAKKVLFSENSLVQRLIALGAPDVAFSHRNLLQHFRGTYELLKSWDQNEALCMAGLFHSVYLTRFFTSHDPNEVNRKAIRDIIGTEAERLVYLYCVIDRREFISKAPGNSERLIFDTYLKQKECVSTKELSHIVELIWANAFEQLLQADAEETAIVAERSVFEATRLLVSEGARLAYRDLYLQR